MSSTITEPTAGRWGPDVSAYQAAMSVVALHIAQAFIKSGSEEVHQWARELAHELKCESCDISPQIVRQLAQMTVEHPDLGPHIPF